MNASSHWWNVAIFLTLIGTLAVLNLVKPGSNGKEIAELEKREMQPWPAFSLDKLKHGQLFKAYDNYFSDHFVFRSNFIELGMTAKSYKGMQDSDGISLVTTAGGNNMGEELGGDDDGAVPAFGQTDPGDGASAPPDDSGEVVNGESSQYLVIKDKAMLLYQYSAESAEAYAAAINHLHEAVGPDVHVYSMLVPSQVEFVESEKLRKLSGSQKQATDHVYELLQPGVKGVPAYEHIDQHKDEYVYFRTDHHWTALGAYYGYEAIAEAMGFDPVPLDQYETKDMPGYLGTAYAATRKPELRKNPDTVTIYLPTVKHEYKVYYDQKHGVKKTLVEEKIPVDGRGGYAVFLGGDFAMSRVTTNVDNGKRLMIIKDSYANAVVPFLLPHFEEIEIVDPRYFKGNLADEVKASKITDVLFVNGPVVTTYKGIANMVEDLLVSK